MQAVPVSFGAGVGFSVRYDADKTRLLGDLRDLANVHVPDRGARSRRYCAADHAREIRAKGGTGFAVALRSRGNPYYLLMTRVNGIGTCAFVDRKVQDGHFYPRVILAHLCFDERVFDGTVIEGDLLRMGSDCQADSAWVFLCTDVLAECGTRTDDRLDDRLARMSRLLSPASHRPDIASDVCLFRPTRYFAVAQLRDVVERQLLLLPSTIDYEITGVVFRPAGPIGEDSGGDIVFSLPRPHQQQRPSSNAALVAAEQVADYYQCRHLEEGEDDARPPDDRPFFVRPTDVPDVYELYDTAELYDARGGAMLAGVPTLRDSAALREATAANPGAPLMFSFSARFGKWVPRTADLSI